MKYSLVSLLLLLHVFLNSQIIEYPISASDVEAGDKFGKSTDISDMFTVVGAYEDDNSTGSVYIFNWSGQNWLENDKLVAFDGAVDDKFGNSVSIDGDNDQFYVIIGAYCDDDNGEDSGSVYFFRKESNQWFDQGKIAGTTFMDHFGLSVSIDKAADETFAIVGTSYNNGQTRSVYIYHRNDNNWNQHYVIQDIGGDAVFGRSVAIQGDYVIIGSPNSRLCYTLYHT